MKLRMIRDKPYTAKKLGTTDKVMRRFVIKGILDYFPHSLGTAWKDYIRTHKDNLDTYTLPIKPLKRSIIRLNNIVTIKIEKQRAVPGN